MRALHDQTKLPWLIGGNFNEIVKSSEKYGGLEINNRRSDKFIQCLNYCNLVDLGYTGSRFTWSNNRQLSHCILERLDRCLTNYDWLNQFPEASVQHLPRTHSGHSPLLLNLNKLKAPNEFFFHFETIWITHPLFNFIITLNWTPNKPILTAIRLYKIYSGLE